MAAQQQEGCSEGVACCICLAVVAAVAGLVYLFVLLGISHGATYSVAVTGVAGLDPVVDLTSPSRATLSPVLNLTVRIDNSRERFSTACVGGFATATVSYGDAFLARGSVPKFCAGSMKARERGARAWGSGVDVPRFLQDQLVAEMAAGEAAVHVEVRAPDECPYTHGSGDTVLVCDGVKIGGGPAPCRQDTVPHHHQTKQAPAGSTN
jgi:hypothetical protein